MANARRVDTATSADWDFLGNEEVMAALHRAARKASYEFDLVDYDDAEHDALLWLSVRPERVAKAIASDDFTQLGQDIYAHALRERAVAESDRAKANHSLDKMQEDGWEL